MKLIVMLLIVSFISYFSYSFISRFSNNKRSKINKAGFIVAFFIFITLLGFLVFEVQQATAAPDIQCRTKQFVKYSPPTASKSAIDYKEKGDYEYDIGNCKQAILEYTKAIEINRYFPQAFNNRAYTYMRMQKYAEALKDLDEAIANNPNYINALMNRGDIHNYYYQINKKSAIKDYEKVITLGGKKETSVCGHLLLAKHDGWNLGTILDIPSSFNNCNK